MLVSRSKCKSNQHSSLYPAHVRSHPPCCNKRAVNRKVGLGLTEHHYIRSESIFPIRTFLINEVKVRKKKKNQIQRTKTQMIDVISYLAVLQFSVISPMLSVQRCNSSVLWIVHSVSQIADLMRFSMSHWIRIFCRVSECSATEVKTDM